MVYLIHFANPYVHAGHYIGYSEDRRLGARLEEHRIGRGARLLQVLARMDVDWEVAQTWPGAGRDFERVLKGRHGASRFCPVCQVLRAQGRFDRWRSRWVQLPEDERVNYSE